MDEIRWGIIGCGDVCEVKSGPAFRRVPGSRLVAVMRRSGACAADYARRHGVPRWYDDATALVADPDVDAVYVATPPGSHLECARLACAAKKPCYVEKPMARNLAECREMLDTFATAGVPLFVAYYRRALERFRIARDVVGSGRLGVILQVSYAYARSEHRSIDPSNLPWRVRAPESGGGFFLDVGSHTVDILDFLLGPLEDVTGTARNVASPYDVEDSVAMHFTMAGGIVGCARWNFASGANCDEIAIEGTRARLTLATFGDEPLLVQQGADVERIEVKNPPHIQEPMIASIVSELLGSGTAAATASSATRASAVMDAVLREYYGSRERPFWDTPDAWPGRRRTSTV